MARTHPARAQWALCIESRVQFVNNLTFCEEQIDQCDFMVFVVSLLVNRFGQSRCPLKSNDS